jgi:putative ABC transport system substrate-binding protein
MDGTKVNEEKRSGIRSHKSRRYDAWVGQMRRRKFLVVLGGAAVAWPLAARAQAPAMPVIGFLGSGSPNAFAQAVAALRRGLNQTGYAEGQNVTIDYRWAEGQFHRLPGLAADLVHRRVALILTSGPPASSAAKAATGTIPIVFTTGDDPVAAGLVTSLNRPGGNVTGVSFFTIALGAKRLELLHELVPNATVFAMILNPTSPNADVQLKDAQAAAHALGQQIHIFHASTEKTEPLPGSLFTVTSPPIMRESLRVMARPRPVPP